MSPELMMGAAALVWLAALSFFVFRLKSHYQRLVQRTGKNSIDEILEVLLAKDKEQDLSVREIKKKLETVDTAIKTHYQKIGLVRFNPFERVGGDQSFVVALLDGEDNGILMNFLYTREGIRVYAKPVQKGKGTDLVLSDEEKEAISKAK